MINAVREKSLYERGSNKVPIFDKERYLSWSLKDGWKLSGQSLKKEKQVSDGGTSCVKILN